jgi:hypothetical protein
LGVAGVSFYKSFIAQEDEVGRRDANSAGKARMVEAFYNPRTGRYEKPRPWDREYQLLKPEVVLVSREEVCDRKK